MRKYPLAHVALTAFALLGGFRFAVAQGVQAPPAAGQRFDAAAFASVDDTAGTTLRWAEPRKIRSAVIEFAGEEPLPAADKLHLQYWHVSWTGKPEPIQAEKGAGSVGWAEMDDWTNGSWKNADTRVEAKGRTLTFTFAPTGEKEFSEAGHGVAYRKTLKLRLACDTALPPVRRFQALTDAVYQPLTVKVLFGKPAESGVKIADTETGHLEVFNGAVAAIRPVGDTKITGQTWQLPAQADSGIEADLLVAVDQLNPEYDRTIVTVRSDRRPFSFAADEAARGDRILVDDLGALVVRASDPVTLETCRQYRKEFAGRTIYQRVFDNPEQTLAQAWDAMPLKRPLYFVHGLPGDRNAMAQQPNGEIHISSSKRWFSVQPSPRDTDRKQWQGETLRLGFGLPKEERRVSRELEEGYLPQLRTTWQDGPIFYEQLTVLDALSGNVEGVTLDDPTLLLVRVRVANISDTLVATASLRMTSQSDKREQLIVRGNRLYADEGEGKLLFREWIETGGRGLTTQEEDSVRWSIDLKPGQAHNVYFAIPSITLDTDAEVDALRERNFEAASARICDFWRTQVARGTKIDTPEPWINDFYKAHLRHMLVNCYKEIGSDRLHAHVGTFSYGVYPNESAMMVSDLDRRGYHREAQQNLDSFLHYQGTVGLNGNYTSNEGLFYGDGGHETGNYNKNHGYILWLMAYHWQMTRDREWLERSADKLLKACDWIVQQRAATMKLNADGSRPVEYGFLPAGGLEDVQDYWYWLATNAATDWGFQAIAAALADIEHPRAKELQEQAAAYHKDFMAGMNEARVRAPVVRLRDGTYVPKIPSEPHIRGRAHGWIRETLEGPMFLSAYRLLDPNSIETRWIVEDYEDNLYISDAYGYQIPVFDQFWFSRGGFSMQANLLDGPLPYLWRDEVKHFLRAYFNGFASAFYPETRMCNEHSLPELGYPAGDHFKSSDEAQSTYWLRLMFVNEQNGDLYLGQAIPRYWMEDGKHAAIAQAASEFGPLSLSIESAAKEGQIKATLTPPTRNPPKTIYLRFRHPESKRIASVTLNGKDYPKFDADKEWVILPGDLTGTQEIIAKY